MPFPTTSQGLVPELSRQAENPQLGANLQGKSIPVAEKFSHNKPGTGQKAQRNSVGRHGFLLRSLDYI